MSADQIAVVQKLRAEQNAKCDSGCHETTCVWTVAMVIFCQGVYELSIFIHQFSRTCAFEHAQLAVFYLGLSLVLLHWCPRIVVAQPFAVISALVASIGVASTALTHIRQGLCTIQTVGDACMLSVLRPLSVDVAAILCLLLTLYMSSRCRGKARYSDTCTSKSVDAARIASSRYIEAQRLKAPHPPTLSLDAALDGRISPECSRKAERQAPSHPQHAHSRRFEFKLTPSSVALASMQEPLSPQRYRADHRDGLQWR